MKKILILFVMLYVNINMFSQVTVDIKKITIFEYYYDRYPSDVSIYIEIHNTGDEVFRFHGGNPYDEFHISFAQEGEVYEMVVCVVDKFETFGHWLYLGDGEISFDVRSYNNKINTYEADENFKDISPGMSYSVRLNADILDLYAPSRHQQDIQDFFMLEYKYIDSNGKIQRYSIGPLYQGEYQIEHTSDRGIIS